MLFIGVFDYYIFCPPNNPLYLIFFFNLDLGTNIYIHEESDIYIHIQTSNILLDYFTGTSSAVLIIIYIAMLEDEGFACNNDHIVIAITDDQDFHSCDMSLINRHLFWEPISQTRSSG